MSLLKTTQIAAFLMLTMQACGPFPLLSEYPLSTTTNRYPLDRSLVEKKIILHNPHPFAVEFRYACMDLSNPDESIRTRVLQPHRDYTFLVTVFSQDLHVNACELLGLRKQ